MLIKSKYKLSLNESYGTDVLRFTPQCIDYPMGAIDEYGDDHENTKHTKGACVEGKNRFRASRKSLDRRHSGILTDVTMNFDSVVP